MRIKVGPGAIARTGPPSLRDARELISDAEKGTNRVTWRPYA